jgi:hypothetical protein
LKPDAAPSWNHSRKKVGPLSAFATEDRLGLIAVM